MIAGKSTVVNVKEKDVLAIKQWLREVILTDELPECVKEFALKVHSDMCR